MIRSIRNLCWGLSIVVGLSVCTRASAQTTSTRHVITKGIVTGEVDPMTADNEGIPAFQKAFVPNERAMEIAEHAGSLAKFAGSINQNSVRATRGVASVAASHAKNSLLAGSTPNLGRGFEGLNHGSGFPPDPTLAVSDEFFVQAVNSSVRFGTKSGKTINEKSLPSFFASVSPGAISDPKVIYDQFAKRFYLIALTFSPADFSGSAYLFGVSASSDPRGTWTISKIPSVQDQDQFWCDYPAIGYDKDAIYITGNIFDLQSFQPSFSSTGVIRKADALAGKIKSAVLFDNFVEPKSQQVGWTIRPVTPLTETDAFHLVSIAPQSGNDVLVWTIPNPFDETSVPTGVAIPIEHYSSSGGDDISHPPSCPELNAGYLKLNDSYIRNGMLYTSFTESANGLDGTLRAVQIDVKNKRVVHDAAIELPNGELFYSSILPTPKKTFLVAEMIDEDGNLGPAVTEDPFAAQVVFTPMHQNDNCYDVSHMGSDSRNRFGDYSTIALDPDGERIWATSEFAISSTAWSTWIGCASPSSTPAAIGRISALGRGDRVELAAPASSGLTITIERRTPAQLTYSSVISNVAQASTFSASDTKVSADSLYCYRFRVANGNGSSDWTLDDTAYVMATPKDLKAVRQGSKVHLTWTNMSNISRGNVIERIDSAVGTWQVILSQPKKKISSFDDTTAAEGHVWGYRVRNAAFSNTSTDIHTSLASPAAGVEASPLGAAPVRAFSDDLSVRPVRDGLSLAYSLESSADVAVEIYDMLGHAVGERMQVQNQMEGKHEIEVRLNASQLTSGAYVVRMMLVRDGGEARVISRRALIVR